MPRSKEIRLTNEEAASARQFIKANYERPGDFLGIFVEILRNHNGRLQCPDKMFHRMLGENEHKRGGVTKFKLRIFCQATGLSETEFETQVLGTANFFRDRFGKPMTPTELTQVVARQAEKTEKDALFSEASQVASSQPERRLTEIGLTASRYPRSEEDESHDHYLSEVQLFEACRALVKWDIKDPEDNLATYNHPANENSDSCKNSASAVEMLLDWVLVKSESSHAFVLGEFGIGKTTTLKRLALALLDEYFKKNNGPIPIYLDLKIYSRFFNENAPLPDNESFIGDLLKESKLKAKQVLELFNEERAVLIFDGLDEKLVHLPNSLGHSFIDQLLRLVPSDNCNCGKLIASCRTHYFTSITDQNTRLRGRKFFILPFSDEQIRNYIRKGIEDGKVDSALQTIKSIYDLPNLAKRPYFLHLIRSQIVELEKGISKGKVVRGVTLYANLVDQSIADAAPRHKLLRDDKPRLMEDLALEMWKSNSREWDWPQVHDWLRKRIYEDTIFAATYPPTTKPFEQLAEDFRSATLVLRPDNENVFRFAHTSLQEYFLACYLYRALDEKRLEAWKIPMVSPETLDFLGQLLEVKETKGQTALETLADLLATHQPQASILAFHYWLRAQEKGLPLCDLKKVDLPGENLEHMTISGRPRQPLDFRQSNFEGARLAHCRFNYINWTGANLRQVKALRAEFTNVNLSQANLSSGDFTGSVWRDVRLNGIREEETQWWDADWIRVSVDSRHLEPVIQNTEPQHSVELALRSCGHSHKINSCEYSPDGHWIVTASDDKIIKVWDAKSGQEVLSLIGHDDVVNFCSFSPDGLQVVSASDDKTVKVWNVHSGEELYFISTNGPSVTRCGYSPNGSQIICEAGGTCLVWDIYKEQVVLSLLGRCCRYSPDGLRIVSTSQDHTVTVWDAQSGQELVTLLGHRGEVTTCGFSPDGLRIVSSAKDNTVKVWNSQTGQELVVFEGHRGEVISCGFSPDGLRIVSSAKDNTVKVWRSESGQELLNLPGFKSSEFNSSYASYAYSPDGLRIVAAEDEILRFLDAHSGKCISTFGRRNILAFGHHNRVTSCAFSPDGLRILSGANGTVKVWDAQNGHQLSNTKSTYIHCCAFSSDGSRLFSAERHDSVMIWDANSGQKLFALKRKGRTGALFSFGKRRGGKNYPCAALSPGWTSYRLGIRPYFYEGMGCP